MLIIILLLYSLSSYGQRLQPSVTALSGGVQTLKKGKILSWTLGEPVIQTLKGSSLILTQGFQQPLLEVTTSYFDAEFDYRLSVFPNPVHFELRLETDYPDALHYSLYNISGIKLDSNKFLKEKSLNFQSYPSGIYVLKVITGEENIRSVLIEKH